jgi:predicted Zn-dependent protease
MVWFAGWGRNGSTLNSQRDWKRVALNPNSFLAWGCRGQVYRIAGLPEEAVRSFEHAIRMSPVDPRLHLTFAGMGMAFIELRRFNEAIVAAKKAQRQSPTYSASYRCLASAFAHLGRDAEAREAAAHLLETDSARASGLLNTRDEDQATWARSNTGQQLSLCSALYLLFCSSSA